MLSTGSCLIWSLSSKSLSSGEAGLGAASAVPCDSMSDGAGVSELEYVSVT